MKHILVFLFLGTWAVALAQAPSDEQGSGNEEQAQEQQAAAGNEVADESGENEGEENGDGENEGEAIEGEVNDDEAVEEGPAEALEGLPPAVETNPVPDPPEPDELSAADEEFEPGEEISEDYPVPLPSDI